MASPPNYVFDRNLDVEKSLTTPGHKNSLKRLQEHHREHSPQSVSSLPGSEDTLDTKSSHLSTDGAHSVPYDGAKAAPTNRHKISDPFLSSSATLSRDQRLSATASTFRPQDAATYDLDPRIPGKPRSNDVPKSKYGSRNTAAISKGLFSTDVGISRSFRVTDYGRGNAALVMDILLMVRL